MSVFGIFFRIHKLLLDLVIGRAITGIARMAVSIVSAKGHSER
jgi:hypothetical protein